MFRIARYFVLAFFVFLAGCNRDPVAQSERLVNSGNKFFGLGKYKEASIMYRRALQKNAKNGEAYYRLGLTSLKQQNWPDAANWLRRATTTPPINPDAQIKLADLYWAYYSGTQANTREKAKSVLPEIQEISESMLAKDPKSFNGLRFAGYLAWARNDLPTALKDFELANQVKPYDPSLTLVYVRVLMQSNRIPEAEKMAKEMISRQKNLFPMYTQLIGLYIAQKRAADAEQILKLEVDNNPHTQAPLVQLAAFYAATQRRPEMEATIQRMISNPKDFPTARLTAGAFFVRLHNFDRARHEFEEGMKASPKDKTLYQKATVETLALEGKTNDASQLVNEILKQDPKDSQAIAMRSALLLKTGSPDQIKLAVADLQGLVVKNPGNAASRFQLGQALVASGQKEAAKIQLEEAKKIDPSMVPPRLLLAQLYGEKQDNARVLAEAEEVLKMQPGNYQARLLHSAAMMGLGKRDQARQELKQLLQQAPNSADARYQLAYLTFQDKNFKEAEDIFRQMQASNPADARGLIGVVESEVALNNYAGAISLLRTELQKNPDRVDYRAALANILVRDKQFDAAIHEFQQIATKNPKSSDIYLKMGVTYQLKGDVNAAIDSYRKARSLAAPNDALPATRLALMLDGVGRRDESKPLYEEILRINPNSIPALNNLAYIKAEEGTDLDTALTLAQRARQSAPQDPNIADTLGWVYIKKNLSDDAIRVYREVVGTSPNNATYHYHLAMALYQKGDKRAAKQALEDALKHQPSPADQQNIRELMGKVGS
jgi:tetratricopeptide (TPR) repeat protein